MKKSFMSAVKIKVLTNKAPWIDYYYKSIRRFTNLFSTRIVVITQLKFFKDEIVFCVRRVNFREWKKSGYGKVFIKVGVE